MRHLAVFALASSACVTQADVAAEMERAMWESNDGLVGVLLSSEILENMLETPDVLLRHDSTENCGCPCVSRLGASPPYVLTLDYKESGCLPDSGLVPTAVTGHVYADFDGTAVGETTWTEFELALQHPVTGSFGGTVTGTTDDLEVHPVGALEVGDHTLAFDVTVHIDETQVTISGSTETLNPDTPDGDLCAIEFDEVVLLRDDIGAPCPRPSAGTATLVHTEKRGLGAVVAYDNPGDGFVTVTSAERESESTDYCAYESELW